MVLNNKNDNRRVIDMVALERIGEDWREVAGKVE